MDENTEVISLIARSNEAKAPWEPDEVMILAEQIRKILHGAAEEIPLEWIDEPQSSATPKMVSKEIRDWMDKRNSENRANGGGVNPIHSPETGQSSGNRSGRGSKNQGSNLNGGVNVIGLPGSPGPGRCYDTLVVYAPETDGRKSNTLKNLMKHVTYIWSHCNTQNTIFICPENNYNTVEKEYETWFNYKSLKCNILVPIVRKESRSFVISVGQPKRVK